VYQGVEKLTPIRIVDLVHRPGHRRLCQVSDQDINLACPFNQCLALFLRAQEFAAAENFDAICRKFFSDGRTHIGLDAGD